MGLWADPAAGSQALWRGAAGLRPAGIVQMPSDRPMAWAERPKAGARLEGAARLHAVLRAGAAQQRAR